MKISELIKQLEELKDEHGDLTIYDYDNENGEIYKFYGVYVTENPNDYDELIAAI